MNDHPSLEDRLKQCLGPEWFSSRTGQGGARVKYLEGNVAINLANDIFGYNGWSTEIKDSHVDFCDRTPDGRYSVGIATTIRIILKDGTYHEDVGYGNSENNKSKAAAFEKARKEAVTDGMKRALRIFGNATGNCVYDKSFLRNLATMSNPTIPFLPFDLYRHPHVRESIQKQLDRSSEKLSASSSSHLPSDTTIATTATITPVTKQQPAVGPSTSAPSSHTPSVHIDDKNGESLGMKRQLEIELGHGLDADDSFFLDDEDDEFYVQIADYHSMPSSPPPNNTNNPPSSNSEQASKRQRQ